MKIRVFSGGPKAIQTVATKRKPNTDTCTGPLRRSQRKGTASQDTATDQLDQAILPLFSLAQFAVEIPLFRELPSQIGPPGEPGSLPFMPPPE